MSKDGLICHQDDKFGAREIPMASKKDSLPSVSRGHCYRSKEDKQFEMLIYNELYT